MLAQLIRCLRGVHREVCNKDPEFRGYLLVLYAEISVLVCGLAFLGMAKLYREAFPPAPPQVVHLAVLYHVDHRQSEPCKHLIVVLGRNQRSLAVERPVRISTEGRLPARFQLTPRGVLMTPAAPGVYFIEQGRQWVPAQVEPEPAPEVLQDDQPPLVVA